MRRLVIMVAGRVAAAGTVHDIIGGRSAVQVDTESWERAFSVLTAAHIPVLLAGRSVRAPDNSIDEVERALKRAGVSARVTAVPSTLDETLITLDQATPSNYTAMPVYSP